MTDAIEINKIASETISVPIVGTMPLIVHNFSEKSKRQMLDAQQGRKTPKLAAVLQRMKTTEPVMFRAAMDNAEFGPRAAIAFEQAGGAT